jgi:lipopolysaccharide biosynthesis glycosyltransferase
MSAVAYCGTRNIYGDMYTSAKSVLYNSSVDKIYFITEDPKSKFGYELSPEMKVINVSKQKYFPADGPNMKNKYTYMAMMRAALCHVLPHEDKILSLDCDTIFNNKCDELWDYDIDDYYFAGVEEPKRTTRSTNPNLQYCNAGVIFYNLAKMRDGKADECIDALNRRRYDWLDQDVVSYLCQSRILYLPGEYNVCPFTVKSKVRPKIIHFAGNKKFRCDDRWKFYEDMPLEIARKNRA